VTLPFILASNLVLIAAIIGLVHWLGRSVTARLESEDGARALFLAEYPAAAVVETVIAVAGDGALLRLEGGRAIGLLRAQGAHWLVRLIEPSSFGGVSQVGCGRIRFRLADFAAPHVALDLGDPALAALWCSRLRALRVVPAIPRRRPLELVP